MSGRTICEVLGHNYWAMQEHYSHIADDTLRHEYEDKYEVRCNLKGDAVEIHRDCDLSGVEWLAKKIGRRLHAFAGGWRGRHISRPCPKTAADGCYFREDFQSDRQFLPIHHDTLARTRELAPLPPAAVPVLLTSTLLARLRDLASKQPAMGRTALPVQLRITPQSHETVVRALRDANRKLNEENERLRNELAVALGRLRDLRRGISALRG
ncbi:hypothetical protein ABZ726_19285 [Streptomyces hundungensis]|uniref:hypothetical protein n=1 Tax=Streptomyces hundungensis TaxID=1077946 RepID=UPI0033FC9912